MSWPPQLELNGRTVRARFDKPLHGAWAFSLLEPVLGARKARVRAPHGVSNPPPTNTVCDIFLLRLSSGDKVWQAALVDPAENRWLNGDAPREGDHAEGVVVRFDEPGRVAIVALDDFGVVDAHITSAMLPGKQPPLIKDVLAKNDLVRGKVRNVDVGTLHVELDIAAARCEQLAEDAEMVKSWQLSGTPPDEPSPRLASDVLDDCHFLIVDNDAGFCDALAGVIRLQGGTARTITNISALGSELTLATQNFEPTHILIDYQLGLSGAFDEALGFAQSLYAPHAMMSGSDHAAAAAAARGVDLLMKPIQAEDLILWALQREVWASTHANVAIRTEELWTYRAGLDALNRQIWEYLNNFARRHKLPTMIWLRQADNGRFEMRACHPQTATWREKLRDVSAQAAPLHPDEGTPGKVRRGRLSNRDPLGRALGGPLTEAYFAALHVSVEGAAPRALIALDPTAPISQPIITSLIEQEAYVKLMVDYVLRVEQHVALESYATTGRLNAGLLHELRNVLGIADAPLVRAEAAINNGEPIIARTAIEDLRRIIDKMSSLAVDGLQNVRPHRRRLVDLNRVVERIVGDMHLSAEKMAHDQGGDPPAILFHPARPAPPLLSLAIESVEQPLINLIDNALHFAPRDGSGKIDVRVGYAQDRDSEALRPIIDVTDNGIGLGYATRARVFEARRTSRGPEGTGLGLFVSRNLLKAEGGDLELVETVRWSGSHFRIWLPMVAGAVDDSMKAAKGPVL